MLGLSGDKKVRIETKKKNKSPVPGNMANWASFLVLRYIMEESTDVIIYVPGAVGSKMRCGWRHLGNLIQKKKKKCVWKQ